MVEAYLIHTCVSCVVTLMQCTIDGERFAGINAHGFNLIEVFAELLLRCLGQKCFLFSVIKRGTYIHGKTFTVLLNIVKNTSLAQRIFPHYGI